VGLKADGPVAVHGLVNGETLLAVPAFPVTYRSKPPGRCLLTSLCHESDHRIYRHGSEPATRPEVGGRTR